MEEKELLLKEIDKFYETLKNNLDYRYNETNSLLDILSSMENDKETKKLLINNELGLLGNYLHKHRLDKDIQDYIYKKEYKLYLNFIKKNKYFLLDGITLPKKLLNDKQFVLELLNQKLIILESVSKELQNDKDVVLAAIKNDITVIATINPDLIKDISFLEKIINYYKEEGYKNYDPIYAPIIKNKFNELDTNDFEKILALLEEMISLSANIAF